MMTGRRVAVGVAVVLSMNAPGRVTRAGSDGGAVGTQAESPTAEMVVATVRSRLHEVKACYDQAVRTAPKLAGKLVARWTIDIAGKVRALSFEENTVGDMSLCVRRVIEGWRFAPPGEATDITFPFVFESAVWGTVEIWMDALKRFDDVTLARLTETPFIYRSSGLDDKCKANPADAPGLKKWVECLRAARSPIPGKLYAGTDVAIKRDPSLTQKLEPALRAIGGGEWVSGLLSGDGVTFALRFLVRTSADRVPRVKAFVVDATPAK